MRNYGLLYSHLFASHLLIHIVKQVINLRDPYQFQNDILTKLGLNVLKEVD